MYNQDPNIRPYRVQDKLLGVELAEDKKESTIKRNYKTIAEIIEGIEDLDGKTTPRIRIGNFIAFFKQTEKIKDYNPVITLLKERGEGDYLEEYEAEQAIKALNLDHLKTAEYTQVLKRVTEVIYTKHNPSTRKYLNASRRIELVRHEIDLFNDFIKIEEHRHGQIKIDATLRAFLLGIAYAQSQAEETKTK